MGCVEIELGWLWVIVGCGGCGCGVVVEVGVAIGVVESRSVGVSSGGVGLASDGVCVVDGVELDVCGVGGLWMWDVLWCTCLLKRNGSVVWVSLLGTWLLGLWEVPFTSE